MSALYSLRQLNSPLDFFLCSIYCQFFTCSDCILHFKRAVYVDNNFNFRAGTNKQYTLVTIDIFSHGNSNIDQLKEVLRSAIERDRVQNYVFKSDFPPGWWKVVAGNVEVPHPLPQPSGRGHQIGVSQTESSSNISATVGLNKSNTTLSPD